MVISRDLSNEQLIDLQLASDEQALQDSLTGLAGWAADTTLRPEHFWSRQRARIRERIAASERASHRAFFRLAWAAALALIIAAAVLLRGGPAPAPQAQADPDHELLLEVERVMQSDGPESLAPAALLVQDVSQNSSPRSEFPIYQKESNHEN